MMTPTLLIVTPCRPAWLHCNFVLSLMATVDELRSRGIRVAFAVEPNATVGRARAALVAQFLAMPGATHLLMLDADMAWRPESVLRLLQHNVEFVAVAGAYRGTGQVIHEIDEIREHDHPSPLISVAGVGACCWLLKRSVIDKMVAAHPELRIRRSGAPADEQFYALFAEMVTDDGKWHGEDWAFCQRWQAIGGHVLVDPTIELAHFVERPIGGRLADAIGPTQQAEAA